MQSCLFISIAISLCCSHSRPYFISYKYLFCEEYKVRHIYAMHVEEKYIKTKQNVHTFQTDISCISNYQKNMHLLPKCSLWTPLALSSVYYIQSSLFLCLETILHRVESDGSTALTDIGHSLYCVHQIWQLVHL